MTWAVSRVAPRARWRPHVRRSRSWLPNAQTRPRIDRSAVPYRVRGRTGLRVRCPGQQTRTLPRDVRFPDAPPRTPDGGARRRGRISDTETGSGTDTDTGSGTETGSGTGTETGSGTETDTDTGAGSANIQPGGRGRVPPRDAIGGRAPSKFAGLPPAIPLASAWRGAC